MVRMSDLARGGTSAPPLPKTETKAAAVVADPPAAPPASATRSAVASRISAPYTHAREAERPVSGAVSNSTPPRNSAEPADRILEELRSFLEGVPNRLGTDEPISWSALQRLVERVVRSVQASGDLFWLANSAPLPDGGDYLAFHHARVTVLAVRIAMTIGYERDRPVEVGVAAALSGIGLWQLPATLLRRLDSLSAEELGQYRAHPRLGAERVGRWQPPFPGLVQTVLQHQERERGQGFPQGLQGPAIRMDAKIVGLADTYMTLTAPPSLRPGLSPYEAVREVVRSKHQAFPSVLVKALLSEVTVFPPGTMVRLNTGEIGSVVAVNRNHPLRPRVQVVGGKTGSLATPKIVDLSEAPFLFVTGPLTETAR